MKPEPKVFTKDSPCTKFDIWKCFRRVSGFTGREVAEAHAVIGLNVPRVMEREGRLVREENGEADCYRLTPEGEAWLLEGFRAYLKNHPAHARQAKFLPKEWGYPATTARLHRSR